jgi:hypothetical protein
MGGRRWLYERLGGVFAIAAVIDHFSDAVIANPGLKFMPTLWVCNVAARPFTFAATKPGSTPLGLEEAHRELRVSPRSSMRSRLSWDAALITSVSPRVKRAKSWRHSRRTRGKSPRDRWPRPERSSGADVVFGTVALIGEALSRSFSERADEHRSERPVFLAVDQELRDCPYDWVRTAKGMS